MFWLSSGQWATLYAVRARCHSGRHYTTTRALAELVGCDPGLMVRRLDRLASLSLLGRHATRGRLGATVLWLPRRAAVLAGAAARAGWHRVNVATSTPFGVFITREGLSQPHHAPYEAAAPPTPPVGGSPENIGYVRSQSSRRPGRPPKQLYEWCPIARRYVRLDRIGYVYERTVVSADYAGACRSCDTPHKAAVTLPRPAPRTTAPVRLGEVLSWLRF